MQEFPELPDEGEALLDALEPLAENLAGGAAVDWDAADSPELSSSHKAVLRQLSAIAQIASAHERFAREAVVRLDSSDMEKGQPIDAIVQGEPRTWGQLILRSYLGRGSFGDVYRAWDPRLDREVALKLLPPPVTGETGRSSVVISEGRALARVRHPNVVTVYGADHINGRIGVWMECVEGRTLAQRIAADGPLAPAEGAAIGADVARALAAVHKAGLLHRDVKAQNVICEPGGRIVLTDFGTAVPHQEKEPADGAALFGGRTAVDTPSDMITPRRATLAGTPLYLAPEVLDGAAQTSRSDIYALGVLLFHSLTGTFPVVGRTLREVHERHREGQRTLLSEVRSDVPLALVSVVERALAADPDARSQTAAEMAAALEDVARVASAVPTATRMRRTTWVAAAVAVAAMGVAAWLAGVVPFRRTGTVAAKEPDLVLVASFENSSGDARAGQLVERAVTEAVTRTRAFAIAPPERVNEVRGYMRRAPDSALDAAAAREAALRDGGIRAVITGSVTGPGDRPAIEVRIVSPVSGATVATLKETSGGGEMARLLAALRAGITSALDAQRTALPAPIAEYEHVTTASFEALRTYTEGRAEFERANPKGAAELFLRAIKFDPDFALAYTWLGWSRHNLQTLTYNDEFAKGDELAQACSPEERLWARGSHLYGLKDDRGANAAFWDLLKLDPLHFWALSNLDYYLRNDLREYEWVISFWEQQAAARPNDVKTMYRTASALLNFESHAGRAWPYFDRFLKATKDAPDGGQTGFNRAYALLAPAWDAWARGRVEEAAERMAHVCAAPAGGPKNVRMLHEACITLNVALGQMLRADSQVPNDWEKADIAYFRGDRETLTRLYESKAARETPLGMWIAPLIGVIDAGGDLGEIRLSPAFRFRHLADLASGPSQETLQWFAKRWQMIPGSTWKLRLAEVYADALVRIGDRGRAIEVLRTATSDRRATIVSQAGLHWVSARNAYAQLLRRLGRDAEAEPVERDLLSMLSEADADHVIAARLRARYGGSAPRPKP